MIARIAFMIFAISAEMFLASCARIDPPKNRELILTFMDFKETYPQGVMTVIVQLENMSNQEITLDEWCVNRTPNNITLYSRPRGTNYDGDIADAEPSNNANFTKLVIPAKTKLQIPGSFICNLIPGDYEFQAALKWTPKVETEWRKCRITPGRLFDTRKGAF